MHVGQSSDRSPKTLRDRKRLAQGVDPYPSARSFRQTRAVDRSGRHESDLPRLHDAEREALPRRCVRLRKSAPAPQRGPRCASPGRAEALPEAPVATPQPRLERGCRGARAGSVQGSEVAIAGWASIPSAYRRNRQGQNRAASAKESEGDADQQGQRKGEPEHGALRQCDRRAKRESRARHPAATGLKRKLIKDPHA